MKKSALLLLSTFLLLAQAIAQQITVSGKVTSGGTPVAGVSVSVKNTKEATLTNQQGDYSVKARQGDVLVFSHIGYVRQEQTVGTSTNIPVQLQSDAVGLDEVIVTGTSQGTTRKQLGSYVSSVKGDDLNKAPSGNVLASLQGKTAGAQISQNSGDPAGGISVRLRGISSVNSSSEPLYIIDGVIVSNNTTRVTNTSANYDGGNFVGSIGQNRMVDINPADIERIEVLNGAAAAAIYGSRANAGVIQIFTKRGASGAPQINFGTSLTLGHLRKQVEVNESPVKFGGSPNVFTQDVIATPLQTTTTPVQRYNYQDYIFRSSTGTDNTLSISGGNDNTKYYTSAGYFSNQGIIRNTNFRRYNFRTNLDQKLTDWAKFSAGLNYVKSSANEKPDGNSFFSPMNSVTILGNFHDIFARNENGNLMAVGERGRVNPVSVIEDIKQRQETDRIIANANLKLTPVKNLTLDFTMGVDNSAQNGTTYIPPFAYNVNPDFFGGGASLDGTLNGYASTANNNAFQFNNELNATYEAKISDILSSTTQVGYSYQYEKSKYALISGRGLAPLIETVNAASTPLPGIDGRTELSVSGGYIQQNFKYRDHLFVTGALRIDQSSVFGKDFRTQKYLKGSVSYVLSSTEYWKN